MPQVPRVVPEYAAIEMPHLRVQSATNWVHSRRVSQTLDASSSTPTTTTTTTNGERVAFGIVRRRATTPIAPWHLADRVDRRAWQDCRDCRPPW